MRNLILLSAAILTLNGCSSVFVVNSEPKDAEVMFVDLKSEQKKSLGKTPLTLKQSELAKAIGAVKPGDFITLIIQKSGFQSKSVSIPVTGFGTLGANLEVKLPPGENETEVRLAKEILDRLFLAQKLALAQAFERAQIELDKILSQFPTFSQALSMRASIYFAQKNYSESLKWYDQALKADPQSESAVRMAAKLRTLTGNRNPSSSPEPPASGAVKP